MVGEIIQSYLVGLGFDVDDQSLAKFNKGLETAAKRVTAVAVAVTGMAAGLVAAFSKTSEGFEDLGYQLHIIAPLINKAIVLRQEMIMSYQRAGVNIRQVIVDSIKLNMSIAKTKLAFEAIYKSVASKFFGVIQKQSDDLRKKLYANMPKIIAILTKFVQVIFQAFGIVARLGERAWAILTRVFDVFKDLDQATNGWSTTILAVVAAWEAFNLSFLASPLGLILALGAAILLLWDDFKTFKEGGVSLINWGSDFTKMIVGLVTIVGSVVAAFYAWQIATKAVSAAMAALEGIGAILSGEFVIAAAPIWAIVAALTALIAALTLADNKWKIFGGGLSGTVSDIGGGLLNKLGGGVGTQSPLGSNGPQGGTTNVNAMLQTSVNVQGSPNAAATGAAVLGGQKNAQADFIRNLVPKIGPGSPPVGQ